MAKYQKSEPLPHVLFIDTNVLWHENKNHPVNPVFDTFWSQYSAAYSIELHVPYVVKGELIFQQATSAMKSLSKAKKNLSTVSEITNHSYNLNIADSAVQKRVEKRMEK